MYDKSKNFICINCGNEVKTLYKKYSSILKLIDCNNCQNVADKYIEYDIVIIIIDLVLFQREAYRHVIFNTEFKNFWKLSIILILMETYSEWILNSPQFRIQDSDQKHLLRDIGTEIADFQFYLISLKVMIKTTFFFIILYCLTALYCSYMKKPNRISFQMIWKTMTISSFGIFLLLPSLIWDVSVQDFHLSVVALYATLCQLLAYTVLCDCPKIWSIFAVFSSYYCKSFIFEFIEMVKMTLFSDVEV